jgi:hypothetical protein
MVGFCSNGSQISVVWTVFCTNLQQLRVLMWLKGYYQEKITIKSKEKMECSRKDDAFVVLVVDRCCWFCVGRYIIDIVNAFGRTT